MSNIPGGYGETKAATEEIQKLCNQVMPEVEKKTNERYKEFTALKYREQVVAGTNFLIKETNNVHVGADYDHLLVFRALEGWIRLIGVQQHKTEDDPLVPFKS